MKMTVERLLEKIEQGKIFKYTYFFSSIHPFSQYYEAHFEVLHGGELLKFTCAEQFMMYMKAFTFQDHYAMNAIMEHPYDPKFYHTMGNIVDNYDDMRWSAVRFAHVVTGNKLKFSQNPELLAYLLSTKDNILVESSVFDKIWGVGLRSSNSLIKNPRNWKGSNLLGFALMDVREQLSLK